MVKVTLDGTYTVSGTVPTGHGYQDDLSSLPCTILLLAPETLLALAFFLHLLFSKGLLMLGTLFPHAPNHLLPK